MNLTPSQRRILDSADRDGRVFTRDLSDVDRSELPKLAAAGYLRESEYVSGLYVVIMKTNGRPIRR